MSRILVSFALLCLPLFGMILSGCGGEPAPPAPQPVMDRALMPENLKAALPEATVRVGALGYGDRVLEQRRVPVPARVLARLKRALGDSGRGFSEMTRNLSYAGESDLGGAPGDHISGELDTGALADAASRAGASGAIRPGLSAESLKRSLAGARFDLYASRPDGILERLDLTLSLDDPDNASPPTRIRFSLTGESSASTK